MIKLLTSNSKKYNSLELFLNKLEIEVVNVALEIPEIQSDNILECVRYKALAASKEMNQPVIVDEVALYLHSYDNYPGPLVKFFLKGLGIDGIKALLLNVSNKATIKCALGIAIGEEVLIFTGQVDGKINLSKSIEDKSMLLSSIFECADSSTLSMQHREKAFKKLQKDYLYLIAKYEKYLFEKKDDSFNFPHFMPNCIFCQEIENTEGSVFYEFVGEEIQERIIYEDEDFIILVPIGCFVEGGVLLLTKKHYPSFAHLPKEKFTKLELLITKLKKIILKIWGVTPIVFEHGPGLKTSKGDCCVDHAHLNIFPVDVSVHDNLKDRYYQKLNSVAELNNYKYLTNGYLLVDSPIDGIYIYDGKDVKSQLIRRYLTEKLGIPERWHWLHYMGVDEMKLTLKKLKGIL